MHVPFSELCLMDQAPDMCAKSHALYLLLLVFEERIQRWCVMETELQPDPANHPNLTVLL